MTGCRRSRLGRVFNVGRRKESEEGSEEVEEVRDGNETVVTLSGRGPTRVAES